MSRSIGSALILAALGGCPLVDEAALAERMDLDGDAVPRPDDCDDDDAGVGAVRQLFADPDGDGFGSGEATPRCEEGSGFVAVDGDCDDGDAAVHPGASEICNDTDDDCDETVDEDALDAPQWHPDADGDGRGDEGVAQVSCSAPDGWLADASDCDDRCPTCWTGAVEACGDELDNDCDGTDAGACALTGEVGLDEANATLICDGASVGYGAPGDVNGDGRDDLAIGDRGGAWLVTSAGSGTRERTADEAWVCGSMGCRGNSAFVAKGRGDGDGDGTNDLLFGQYYAGVWIVPAPASGEVDARSAATTQITGVSGGPRVVDWVGDFDGDGNGDVLVTATGSSSDEPEWAWIVPGPFAATEDWEAAGIGWRGPTVDGSAAGFGHAAAAAGDLDGDGLGDIAVGAINVDDAAGAVYIFNGGNLVTGTSEDADFTLTGPARAYLGYAIGAAGDTDGDGRPDLLVGGYVSGAWLLRGGAVAEGLIDDVASAKVAEDPTRRSGLGHSVAGNGDVNGDGLADLLVGAPNASNGSISRAGAAWLFLSPLSGVLDPEVSATARLGGTQVDEFAGMSVSLAHDLDGDGFDEAVVGHAWTGGGAETEHAAFVFRGGVAP